MLDPLFKKLQQFTELSAKDRQRLEACPWRVHQVAPHIDLVEEGGEPRYVNLVLEGWACRYKQLEDGRRQIIAFFLPGDMCDPCVFLLREMSHSLAAITSVTVAQLPEQDMQAVLAESTGLSQSFWFEMLVASEVQREWTVSLGRRTAIERMAHLFCELLLRQRAVGLGDGNGCDMPITQADLGDALGLSAVHVNRTLQELRGMKLLDLKGRRLFVANEKRLQALALFNPDYLHLQRHTS